MNTLNRVAIRTLLFAALSCAAGGALVKEGGDHKRNLTYLSLDRFAARTSSADHDRAEAAAEERL